jgi:hypothetical protein
MAAGSKQERRRDASNEVAVAEPDRQALLTALTTEHFTLAVAPLLFPSPPVTQAPTESR